MIVVLIGVSGCGKTTLGRALAEAIGWAFIEGDDLHPASNMAKMRVGESLDDDDRRPWLAAIREAMNDHLVRGTSAIVTCSALKRRYRVLLRQGDARIALVSLLGGALANPAQAHAILHTRLAGRTGHFFAPSLLADQLATWEPPDAIGPQGDVQWTLDGSRATDELLVSIRQALKLPPATL